MKRTARALMVAALAVALFLAGGIGLLKALPSHSSQMREVRSTPAALPPPVDVALLGTTSLPQIVSTLQARLRAYPSDWQSWAQLGEVYVQQARVTADPSYYPRAEGALERSLRLSGATNFDAMTGMAALAAARHDFAGALAWSERALSINPDNANILAVKGDAQVELGRYQDAFDTFQKAVDLKPNLATYARASYAWELQGNAGNAIRAMQLALQAAGSQSDAAWAANQLGDLYWNTGRIGEAERYYQLSVAYDHTFVPPHAGLAKVALALGQPDRAMTAYRAVVARYPLPEYVIALGDLASVSGHPAEAAQQVALVHVEERLFQANGVNMDLEIALFDADHRVDLAAGLAAARAEWARRQSINVADAVAWELYANGLAEAALPYANQALHLGTRSALFLYHRAIIERALGQLASARRDLAEALSINPHFSIPWAGPAARLLAQLGGRP